MPIQEYYIHPKTKENHCGRCGLVVKHAGDPHDDTEGRVCEPGAVELATAEYIEIEPVASHFDEAVEAPFVPEDSE